MTTNPLNSTLKATSPTVHAGYPNVVGGSGTSYGFTASTPVNSGQVNYTFTAPNTSQAKIMQWGSLEQGDMDITFFEEENGSLVKAKLSPAYDLTPGESLAINLLITRLCLLEQGGAHGTKPISYLRKHNLERHFQFGLA